MQLVQDKAFLNLLLEYVQFLEHMQLSQRITCLPCLIEVSPEYGNFKIFSDMGGDVPLPTLCLQAQAQAHRHTLLARSVCLGSTCVPEHSGRALLR